jgi:hypothetical protein
MRIQEAQKHKFGSYGSGSPTLLFTSRDRAQDSVEMEETSAILIVAAFFGGGSWSSLGLRRVGKHLFVAILIPRAGTKTQLI